MTILSGCPVLESLTLRLRCSFRNSNLQIDSVSLRELAVEALSILSLDISAPNLLSLHLSGEFVRIVFRPNGLSSLAEAELNFKKLADSGGYFYNQLKLLLEQLQHVAKITIGRWCLKDLSAAEVKETSHLSLRWRDILVYTTFYKLDLPGLAYLLQSSPLLERLVIRDPKSKKFTDKNFPGLCDFEERPFWCSQRKFYCMANHLKRVEIVGFEFDNKKSKLLLSLVKFLLKEAIGLEKMIIDAELRKSYRGEPIVPHDLIQLQDRCRRVFKNVEVIVKYRLNGLSYKLCKHKQIQRYWYRNKFEFGISFGSSFTDFH